MKKSFENIDLIEIGKRLRIVRGKISKKQFAENLGLADTTYAKYEKGETFPFELAVVLANKKLCSIDWLITGNGRDPLDISDLSKSEQNAIKNAIGIFRSYDRKGEKRAFVAIINGLFDEIMQIMLERDKRLANQ